MLESFSNKFNKKLEEVEDFISEMVNLTSKKEVISICDNYYIFFDDIWIIL